VGACGRLFARQERGRQATVRQVWRLWHRGRHNFDDIARHFKVSQLVAARRALDESLISKAQFFKFYKAYSELELKPMQSTGGNFYATAKQRVGRRFGKMIGLAVEQEKLFYRDAYRLTGLSGKTFDTVIGELISRC
jgi:hypothetical protein